MQTRQRKAPGGSATRGRRKPTQRAESAAADAASGKWDISGIARHVRLAPGLHALVVGKCEASRESAAGFALPMTHVVPRDTAAVTIFADPADAGGWLGAEGGIVILRAGGAGGTVLVTTYGIPGEAALPALKMLDLDRLEDVPATRRAIGPPGRELASELVLHIERQGDRRFPGGGWAGNPGARLRVEGFAVRPLEAIAPGHIEYMGFGPGGRQTPWVTDVKLCGTRGRGYPLTGFAIRLAPALGDRFDVVYEGYFFDSGIRGPLRNGEPCLPAIVDDPLGAIRLRVIERSGA